MSEQTCKQCIYYCRHYMAGKPGAFIEVNCGHCIYAKTKHKKADTKACAKFQAAQKE